MPTAILQTFLFALCWNILTRAAFCLFCDSLSMHFPPFLRLLFTDLRSQWLFHSENSAWGNNTLAYGSLGNDKILHWQTDIASYDMALSRKVYCSLSETARFYESIFPSTKLLPVCSLIKSRRELSGSYGKKCFGKLNLLSFYIHCSLSFSFQFEFNVVYLAKSFRK